MAIKILSQEEKNNILKKLWEQFAVKEVSGKFIMIGSEKLLLFTGNFDEKQIKALDQSLPIEKIGVYFAKIINDEIKLTIEGAQALSSQIKKNIVEINKEQAEEWMKGKELNIKTGIKGFVVIKHENDFLGCGKASQEKITNFIPKPRRLKQRS